MNPSRLTYSDNRAHFEYPDPILKFFDKEPMNLKQPMNLKLLLHGRNGPYFGSPALPQAYESPNPAVAILTPVNLPPFDSQTRSGTQVRMTEK
jgi:hypothetical protein